MFGCSVSTSACAASVCQKQGSVLPAIAVIAALQVLTKVFCMLYNKDGICSQFENVGLARAHVGAAPVSYTKYF
jgi:hypothetical protein